MGSWSCSYDIDRETQQSKEATILLCVIDSYGRYAWVSPMRGKKVLQLPSIKAF